MVNAHEIAVTFFQTYAQALLARDAEKLSRLYAVPALIAFPQQTIPVTNPVQTREFFEQGWDQYQGITEVEPAVSIVAATSHSIWADVVWSYSGQPRERFIYQLLGAGDEWQVGVLTPLQPDD